MLVFAKSNAADKDLYCNTIYQKSIADTSEFITACEGIAKVLDVKLPPACYTNFRDALFHFRRMVKSSEENEIAKQAFAIEEHANRVKTDAIIGILENCSNILQILQHNSFELDDASFLRLISVKNMLDRHVMHLRLSGIMLDHTSILRISDEEFQAAIKTFFDFIDAIGKDRYHSALEIRHCRQENT